MVQNCQLRRGKAPGLTKTVRPNQVETALGFPSRERECFIDNLLVRIHLIIEIIWWTGLAPWEFEFPFPGSLISTFLDGVEKLFSS